MDVRPDIGNICKSIPNQSIRRSANQKEGMAKAKEYENGYQSVPVNEFCLQAEITPAGMAVLNSVRKSEIAFMETVSGSLFYFSSTGLASADIDFAKIKMNKSFEPIKILDMKRLVQAINSFLPIAALLLLPSIGIHGCQAKISWRPGRKMYHPERNQGDTPKEQEASTGIFWQKRMKCAGKFLDFTSNSGANRVLSSMILPLRLLFCQSSEKRMEINVSNILSNKCKHSSTRYTFFKYQGIRVFTLTFFANFWKTQALEAKNHLRKLKIASINRSFPAVKMPLETYFFFPVPRPKRASRRGESDPETEAVSFLCFHFPPCTTTFSLHIPEISPL